MSVNSARASLNRRFDDPRLRTAAIAVLIAVGYYVGSRFGFLLKFPPLTPSVMWPPNAILTAALLLTPPRRWWIYLLAVLPAHLATQLPHAFPIALILVLFATNCSEALVAALLIRRFAAGGHITFDSLRSAGTFILCAGLAAPFLTSFLDAAAVTLLRGESYELVWRTRFFGNTLTELSLVPPLLMVFAPYLAWTRRLVRRRWIEAVALCACLVAISTTFGASDIAGDVEVSPMIALAFILPFTIWAAVRLGPAGTSLSLLTIEVAGFTSGMLAENSFAVLMQIGNILSLQIVLIVMTIPLMCVAALIEEHELTRRTLVGRLRFEEMLSRLSRAFVHLPSHEIDHVIGGRLHELGEYLGVHHITIYQFSPTHEVFSPTHAWAASPVSAPQPLPLHGTWEELTELPTLVTDVCVVRFGPLTTGRPWPLEMVSQLRLVAEVFANVIARKKAEDALRASEIMNTAILGSLNSSVAVLDRDGRVVAINAAWRRFGQSGHDDGDAVIDIGATAEALCRHAFPSGSLFAAEAKDGIRSVIDGKSPEFALEYPRPSPAGERWFAMAVLPLNREEGGAVVSLTDVTERRRVELDAQQTRQELAHFTRVLTIGELTASVAHELNQPLSGILANARAGQRFLAASPPNLDEVRDCLADIVADDRRASDVIRRLRELLRKGKVRPVLLDINLLVGEVVNLLSNDALMRDIAITLDLEPGLPFVKADRVQMQQVILNLIVNAMEAVTGADSSARVVIVRTTREDDHTAHVAVEDTGSGLEPGTETTIFEPFYTTKAEGMGMGLSIARSIVVANGGRIWAVNNRMSGTTFHVTVPVAGDQG
jgi:signal transduction histidine kinase/integral membrane sensor domain MASE1